MSETSKPKRVAARTSRDLYGRVKDFVAAQSNVVELELNDRVFGIEAFVNALLIDFFDRDEASRQEVLRRNVPRYERHQKGEPLLPRDRVEVGGKRPPGEGSEPQRVAPDRAKGQARRNSS